MKFWIIAMTICGVASIEFFHNYSVYGTKLDLVMGVGLVVVAVKMIPRSIWPKLRPRLTEPEFRGERPGRSKREPPHEQPGLWIQ